MAPKTKAQMISNGEMVGEAVITNGTAPQSGPPYDADWLTIKNAALRANVSGQAIRKATEKYIAIFDGKTFMAAPCDMFGNTVGRAIEYVDAAAIDAWLAAKAENPSRRGGRKPADGARAYTVRLTDDQATNIMRFLETQDGFNGVVFKRNERKPKAVSTNGVNEPNSETQAANDLFDVDVS